MATGVANYPRPRSIEMEVNHKSATNRPIRQTEILEDLVKISGHQLTDPKMPIESFQRNQDGSYTATMKSITAKLEMQNKLDKGHPASPFNYKTASADIVGGRLTIIGCPGEYPNTKIALILRPYVDQTRVKDGMYKDFPNIKNGMKHVTYRKQIKPIPSFITLPEGIRVKIKTDGENQKCFNCGGNHMARDCQREQNDREHQNSDKTQNVPQPNPNDEEATEQHEAGPQPVSYARIVTISQEEKEDENNKQEEVKETKSSDKNNNMANGTKPKQKNLDEKTQEKKGNGNPSWMSPKTVQKALKYVRREAEDQLLRNPVETQNRFQLWMENATTIDDTYFEDELFIHEEPQDNKQQRNRTASTPVRSILTEFQQLPYQELEGQRTPLLGLTENMKRKYTTEPQITNKKVDNKQTPTGNSPILEKEQNSQHKQSEPEENTQLSNKSTSYRQNSNVQHI